MNAGSELPMGQVVTDNNQQDPLFKGHIAVPERGGQIVGDNQSGIAVGASISSPPPVVVAVQETPRDCYSYLRMLVCILTYNNALWLAFYLSLMIAFMIASSIVWTLVPDPRCRDNCTETLCEGVSEYDDSVDGNHPCECTTTDASGVETSYCEELHWPSSPLITLGYTLSLVGYMGLMASPICCCIAVMRSCRTKEARVHGQQYAPAVNIDEERAFP